MTNLAASSSSKCAVLLITSVAAQTSHGILGRLTPGSNFRYFSKIECKQITGKKMLIWVLFCNGFRSVLNFLLSVFNFGLGVVCVLPKGVAGERSVY